jgi:NADP-dependent 3-hydroxy acid dehydrogenase YdfG
MDGAVTASRRAAIVTGGSSGIGLAIARMLVEEGHAVTLAANRTEELEGALDSLRRDGAEAQAVAVNLAEPGTVESVVDAHRLSYGRLDVLVNNAGLGVQAPIAEMPDSRIDLQFDVNVHAIVRAYRAALPLLREAAREHRNALVVNTASISAKHPEAGLSIYSATKAAVIAFSHAMNKELGPEGIKSTVLAPGIVATALSAFVADKVRQEDMIQPRDVAELVRALLRLGPSCLVSELDIGRAGSPTW